MSSKRDGGQASSRLDASAEKSDLQMPSINLEKTARPTGFIRSYFSHECFAESAIEKTLREYRVTDFTNPASSKRWVPYCRFRLPIRDDRLAHHGKEQIPWGRHCGVKNSFSRRITNTPEGSVQLWQSAVCGSSITCVIKN